MGEALARENFLPYFTECNGTHCELIGGTEYNHISPDVVGPLKHNLSIPCPRDYSADERKKDCISLQESVWGHRMWNELKDIKNKVDKDSVFDCRMCVGNDFWPS